MYMAIAPSSRVVMNSAPRKGATARLATKTAPAVAKVTFRWARARSSSGR